MISPGVRRQAVAAEALVRPLATADAVATATYALAVRAQGDSYGWNDDYARVRPHLLKAERFIAALPPAIRDDRRVLSVCSGNLRLLAEASHKVKAEADAVAAIDRAVTINRRLVARSGGDTAMTRKLTTSLWYRAVLLRMAERDAEVRSSIVEAVTMARGAMERDPSDAGAAHLFAITGEVDAQVAADIGDPVSSRAISDEVIAALSGGAVGTRRSMASALRTRGGNFYNLHDYPAACIAWREARAMLASLDWEGVLTATDRANALPQIGRFVRDSCEGGSPRPGSGPAV